MIPVFNTYIAPSAFDKVREALQSTFLSEGRLVKEFEKGLTSELGCIHPVALNSGTSALHLAVVLAGVGPGDEVICPAQTFVATSLVVSQERAVPVFADIQYDTGNIDPASIRNRISKRTKAIIAVHWGGYPCDMDEIHAIAREHNLVVIEDAAHAPGAEYKGKKVGSISDITCFSFQAIKHITTGDGGAICCLDPEKAHASTVRRWFGIDRANSPVTHVGERDYNITEVGYKYHLNDYGAALGLANLEGFNQRLEKRRQLAALYRKSLAGVPGLRLFEAREDRKSAYWLFGMHVENRDGFIQALKDWGVTASVIHQGIDRNDIFGGKKPELVNQRKFDDTQIHIPIHDALNQEDVEYIIDVIKKGW